MEQRGGGRCLICSTKPTVTQPHPNSPPVNIPPPPPRKYDTPAYHNTKLFKIVVGVQLSSGNPAPNSGNNHRLTIPFEGGMHSFKRQGAGVSRN